MVKLIYQINILSERPVLAGDNRFRGLMRRKNTAGRLFDRIESKSLSAEVVSQIENLILSGVLNEGELLPGERELAEQFGISRPKVREALSQLADSQLVRIVANDGVYVAQLGGEVMSPALVALFNRSANANRDNLEYRRENEGFASRLAAQRATDEDRAELKRILKAIKAADEVQNNTLASELDMELHHTIAFAAHNRTLTHMMTALYSLNRSSISYNRHELMNMDKVAEGIQQQHEDIVAAICQSKPAQAEKAAHAHIDFVTSLVITAFEQLSRESLSGKRYRQKKASA